MDVRSLQMLPTCMNTCGGTSAQRPATWLLCVLATTLKLLGKEGIAKQKIYTIVQRCCISLLCPYTKCGIKEELN